jgi:hypothetical protein
LPLLTSFVMEIGDYTVGFFRWTYSTHLLQGSFDFSRECSRLYHPDRNVAGVARTSWWFSYCKRRTRDCRRGWGTCSPGWLREKSKSLLHNLSEPDDDRFRSKHVVQHWRTLIK